MEHKTSLASGIEVTQAKEQYDAACKRLLSEKIILAHILKSCVSEFRDHDAAFIAASCIEGQPYINIYRMTEHALVGDGQEPVENYDLISLVMIHLGSETGENYSGVLKLLGTLFTSGATVETKKQILQDEFDIPMTRTIEKEVSSMGGSFYEAALARRWSDGVEQGYENGVLASIHSLMESMNLTADEAMTALRVPETARPDYRSHLQQRTV